MKMTTAHRAVWVFCLLAMLVGCASPNAQPAATPSQTTLTVLAAASLAEPFAEIGQAFEARPENLGVTVEFSFAGSQQLARQINEGAPADVFASANQAQMDAVITEGRVDSASAQVFAKNRLLVIVPDDNPGSFSDLSALSNPGLKIVLAAKEVPAGQYSLEFLAKASANPSYGADYQANVLKNVVSYEENVRAVLTKVQLGEADAGIVYASDAAEGVQVIAIPEDLNVIASYPIAPISGSPNTEIAQRFVDFVLSPQGQAVLARYGFGPVR